MNYWKQSKDNIWVAAHRGWCEKYPENTLEAFRAALELGVDQIETDVRLTKDGELVLIHDETVDRTTLSTGKVRDYTLQELREMDAGSKKGEEFRGAKIPTLRELLELVKDHPTITLDLELKEYPTEGWEAEAYSTCDRTIAMVEEYGFGDRIVLNTFSGKLHEYIQDKYGNKYRQHVFFPIHFLGRITRDPYDYAYCACMFASFWSKYNVAAPVDCDLMRSRGVEPWAGAGVRDASGVEEAIKCGVTLITCNNPDVILRELRLRGKYE